MRGDVEGMEGRGRPELFAVIGKPVIHSRSPQMHNAAFRELGLDAVYIRLAAGSPDDALASARAMGIRGMNVTAPFKGMTDALDGLDPSAEEAGAVNTVLLRGKTKGYNTDSYGIAEAFTSNGVAMKGKKALVLGAGGASRAALLAALGSGAEATVANRTPEKAEALAREFGAGSCPLSGPGFEKALRGCQIIIGCLSTGERVVPEGMLNKGIAIMDAYYAEESALVKDGREAGCRVIDGREWLVHQGAKSFELFTGRKAPLDAMRKAAYSETPDTKRNIALVGFMGSGKSTVAMALRERSGMTVVGIDAEVEKRAGTTIRRIFEEKGEAGFRALERAEVARVSGTGGSIIDCGGGAVLDPRNREALGRSSIVVWLFADAKTSAARVPRDGTRPLLDVENPGKRAEELLGKRISAYAASSDVALDSSGMTPAEISERIMYETHKAVPGIGKD